MTPLGVVLVFVLALTCLGLGEGIRRLLASRSRSVEDSMLALVVGWVLLSWWGVLLAESGEFRPLVFVGPPMTLLAAVWWARPSSGPGSYRAEPVVVLALGLTVAIGIAAFFPAFDVQLEARDPGTYFHTGRSLADRGSLTWNDDTVLRLSPSTRLELFPQAGSDRAYDSSRYLGFYLEDRDSGRVVPQASPVYPVWVAVGHWIAGATGGRAVASILMLIGGCLLSLLGAAFAGRIGLAAGPLFVAGVVPGWFARFSAAESAAVVAVCAGSLGLLRYRQKGRRVDALVAGLCFGLCPLAKAELLVVLFPLAALFFLDIVTRRFTVRDLIFLWLPISALSAHQLLHATGWLWPYYSDLLLQYGLTAPVFLGGAAGATLAGILTAMAVRRLLRSNAEQLRAFLAGETVSGRMARWMAAIGVLALTAAGYWWRPYQYVVDRGTDSWNMANHVELGLSISPWFVFLAAVGAALVITNRHDRRGIEAAAFLLIVLAALILYERNIIPRPMWSLRRYVPIVIPVHYVLALLAVGWTARRLAAWRVPVALTSALLIAPAVWHHATVGADVKRHVELSGATEAARGLAELFGPEDVVLFEARTRRGLERFEAALGLVNGPTIYRLPGPTIDSDLLSTIARERSRVDGDTYLVTTGYFDGLGDLGAERVEMFEWDTGSLEEFYVYDEVDQGRRIRLPSATVPMRFRARIYRLLPGAGLAELPIREADGVTLGELDVGLWDEPYLIGSTLHQPEYAAEHNFRWTSGSSSFLLAGIPTDADSVILRIVENEYQPPQEVDVWLDDVYLGKAAVPARWADVRFAIPPEWSRPADGVGRLRVEAPTVSLRDLDPDQVDSRSLGIRVDKVFWARTDALDEG